MITNIPEEIKLKTGESTSLKFKGMGTAGYEWNYTIDGSKDCVDVSKEFDSGKKSGKQNVGASADEIFTLAAKKSGTVVIYFTEQRSWEKNSNPVNEKKVSVTVE